MTSHTAHHLSGNIMGILAIALWSASALIVVYTGNMPPYLVGAVSSFVAFLLFLLKWVFIDRSVRKNFIFEWKDLAVVYLGILFYFILYLSAFKLAPPLEANLLNYMWPILIIIFGGWIFKRHRLGLLELAGALSGFFGVALIIMGKGELSFSSDHFLGHMLAFLGAVVWAFYSNLTHKGNDNINLVGIAILMVGVVFTVLHVLFEEWYEPTLIEWINTGLLGVVTLGYAFWDNAMKKGNTKMLASLSYFIPLLSTVLLVIFHGTHTTNLLYGAIVFIVGGCLLVNAREIIRLLKQI